MTLKRLGGSEGGAEQDRDGEHSHACHVPAVGCIRCGCSVWDCEHVCTSQAGKQTVTDTGHCEIFKLAHSAVAELRSIWKQVQQLAPDAGVTSATFTCRCRRWPWRESPGHAGTHPRFCPHSCQAG
jgi:hypothetical protein